MMLAFHYEVLSMDKHKPNQLSLKEWGMAGGGVPKSHKGREHVWHRKVQGFAAGGEVHMAGAGAVKKAVKGAVEGVVEGIQKILPRAEADANKAKFLAESKEPRRMYHATASDFKEYLPSGSSRAVFVTPETKFAEDFARDNFTSKQGSQKFQTGSRTMPVRVQVKNPFDYEDPKQVENLKTLARKRFPGNEQVLDEIDALGLFEHNWPSAEHPDVQRLIKQAGHDAFYASERGTKNLGVYDPNRIKSDIGNRGTYDVTKGDINEAHGGVVHMSKGGGAKEAAKEALKAGLKKLVGVADAVPEGVEPIVVKEKPAKKVKPLDYSPKVLESTAARFADRIAATNPKLSDEEVAKKAMNQATKKLEWERTQKPALEKRYGNLVRSSYSESNVAKQQNTPAVVQERMRKANEFLDQPTEPWTPPRSELQAFDRASIKDALGGFPGVSQSQFPRDIPARANIAHVEGLYTDPANRALIEKQIKRGLPLGGETFYASLYPVKQAALEAGMPPEKFEKWIHSLAPASARNSIMNEMASGQFLRDMHARGIPLTEENVAREMALYKEKFGIGLPLMPLHREGVAKVLEGGQNLRDMSLANIPTNYKIPTYGSQKAGDFANSVVLDVHEAGGQTQGSKFHPYFNEQGGFGNTEYNAGEQGMLGIAKDLGIPGGMAQAGRWFGGGELTGLRSPRGDALDLLEKQVAYTLKQKGIQPNPANVRAEVLRQIETGEGDLLPWYRGEAMPDVRQTGLQRAEGGDVHMADGGEVHMGDGGDPRGEIRAYDPTTRERMAAALQEGLERFGANRYKARKNAQTVMGGPGSALPMNMGAADVVPFLGTGLGVEEGARDLGQASDAFKRGDYIDAAVDTAGAAMGLIPGASGTIKGLKGGLDMAKRSPALNKAAENVGRGYSLARVPVERPFTPTVATVEATAPDLGQGTTYGFRQGLNDVLLENPQLGKGRNKMREGQGTFTNEKNELELNPMLAIDVRGAGSIGDVPNSNKALRQQIAQLGVDLNQEAMAAHRFIPLATNNVRDASSALIKTSEGLTPDEIAELARRLGGKMAVTHNPKLGGVVVFPFGSVREGLIPRELLRAQQAANDFLGKRGQVQFGISDFGKDRAYLQKSEGDYTKAGALPISKEQQAQREKLQGLEKFMFPASRSGIPGQVKAAPVGGLQPWSVGPEYPTSVIGIGNGNRVQYQPVNFSTGKEGARYDKYLEAEAERATMLDEFHRALVPKYR